MLLLKAIDDSCRETYQPRHGPKRYKLIESIVIYADGAIDLKSRADHTYFALFFLVFLVREWLVCAKRKSRNYLRCHELGHIGTLSFNSRPLPRHKYTKYLVVSKWFTRFGIIRRTTCTVQTPTFHCLEVASTRIWTHPSTRVESFSQSCLISRDRDPAVQTVTQSRSLVRSSHRSRHSCTVIEAIEALIH